MRLNIRTLACGWSDVDLLSHAVEIGKVCPHREREIERRRGPLVAHETNGVDAPEGVSGRLKYGRVSDRMPAEL